MLCYITRILNNTYVMLCYRTHVTLCYITDDILYNTCYVI